MSIASEITRIKGNITDSYSACNTKGATLPIAANQDSDHLAETILTIPQTSPTPTPSVAEKAVNLIDIDGTLLYSYTKTEAQALTELPSTGGTHTGLTFDGWNWQLASIKSYITNHPNASFSVKAQYAIPNNETRFYITIPTNQFLTVPLRFSGAITVDWGDGTTTSETDITSHTYTPSSYPASYVIKCTPDNSSNITWGDQTGTTIFGGYKEYISMLTKIELGCGEFRQYGLQGFSSLTSFLYSSNISNRQTTSTGGASAFINCYSLKHLALSRAIHNISQSAFSTCSSLETLVIPDSVTAIGESAFSTIRALKSISIPDSVLSIGKYAFYDCSALQEFRFPALLATISQYALQSCSALKHIEISDSVTAIGNAAFKSCESLQSINLPSSIETIGNSVFDTCRSLASIIIPKSVTSIGDNVFNACEILTFVDVSEFDSSVPSIGNTNVFPSIVRLGAKSTSMVNTFIAETNWNTYSAQFFVKSW